VRKGGAEGSVVGGVVVGAGMMLDAVEIIEIGGCGQWYLRYVGVLSLISSCIVGRGGFGELGVVEGLG